MRALYNFMSLRFMNGGTGRQQALLAAHLEGKTLQSSFLTAFAKPTTESSLPFAPITQS